MEVIVTIVSKLVYNLPFLRQFIVVITFKYGEKTPFIGVETTPVTHL